MSTDIDTTEMSRRTSLTVQFVLQCIVEGKRTQTFQRTRSPNGIFSVMFSGTHSTLSNIWNSLCNDGNHCASHTQFRRRWHFELFLSHLHHFYGYQQLLKFDCGTAVATRFGLHLKTTGRFRTKIRQYFSFIKDATPPGFSQADVLHWFGCHVASLLTQFLFRFHFGWNLYIDSLRLTFRSHLTGMVAVIEWNGESVRAKSPYSLAYSSPTSKMHRPKESFVCIRTYMSARTPDTNWYRSDVW